MRRLGLGPCPSAPFAMSIRRGASNSQRESQQLPNNSAGTRGSAVTEPALIPCSRHDRRELVKLVTTLTAAIAAVATSSFAALALDISGAGATFPYPIYAKWADSYKKETGNGLNYQSIGSGGGIKQIQAKTVTFGASDLPLQQAQLTKDGLIQFPMVMGGRSEERRVGNEW